MLNTFEVTNHLFRTHGFRWESWRGGRERIESESDDPKTSNHRIMPSRSRSVTQFDLQVLRKYLHKSANPEVEFIEI